MKNVAAFDADGLLFDTFPPHFISFNYLIGHYGLPPMDEDDYKRLNVNYRTLYRDLGITDDFDKLNEIYWPVFNYWIRKLKPEFVPNARETLIFLNQNLVHLILVTNQTQENIEFYDSYNHFLPLFNEIVYVRCPLNKETALRNIKDRYTDKENINFSFISDTPDDLIAGQRASWTVYGVPKYGFSAKENLENVIRPERDAVLQDIYEIVDIFKQQ